MIVCHCNRIDHHDIERAANTLSNDDPLRLLTPVSVYKFLGKRPKCGGCLGLANNIIHTRGALDASGCAGCPMATVDLTVEAAE